MDNQQHHHHQNIMRNHKKEEKLRTNHQESDHNHHQNCSSSSSTPPSSNSSSPSHEFSFTISFQQTNQIPPPPPSSSSSFTTTTTTTTTSSSFAIDLSPADDIFFHGHLLPLTLLSHLPLSSPRSSTNSLDSFKLPKKDHFFHQQQDHKQPQDFKNHQETSCHDAKGKPKPKPKPNTKSFSLFGIPKWRKGYEVKDQNKEKLTQQYSKKKIKMSEVVKRYIRMVRPFLSFRNKKNNNNVQFHRDTYSFSGNLLSTRGGILKGQYSSAPASMTTSPTNSGLLVATPTGSGELGANYYYYNKNCTNQYSSSSCSSSSDSTMEELQAAIQAAIAHCKKSFSMED